MAETQTLFTTARYLLRQSISNACNDLTLVTPDSGDATSLVDANLPEADDYYNKQDLAFYAGDNTDKVRAVTDWVLDTHTLSFATVTTAVDAADLAELHVKFTTSQYNDAINRAINKAADVYLVHNVDETLILMAYKEGETRAMKREYDIPAGFDYIKDVFIEASQTHGLIDCEEVWTDLDAAVTAALDTKDYQEGSNSIKFTVADTISNGDVIGSKDLSAAEDLSVYKKISFWIKASSAVAAKDLELLLAANSAVETPIETIELPALVANTWTFVQSTLAAPASDTAILSIGLEYDDNKKANTIWIDDIRAVLDGQPRFDKPLDPRSWSIVHDTTPLLKLNMGVGITPGKALRLTGQTHQAVLSLDATACAVPPEFIVQQALAFLYQSKPEYAEEMKLAQALADMEKSKMRTMVRVGSKAVKEF